MRLKAGKVYLVGAGPGDPGLITVKGMELLARADVIIYDHLMDERLLETAPAGAEKIYAGKTGAHHTREQEEINQLLIEKAGEGKTVVRLKGGDPFVLGRGGEEAEALADNHIPFEIVPGISSAVAVPAYAGIPVTHRESASSFAVITGHEDPEKSDSSIQWEKLATGVDTLIFLMGMQNLPEIAARLIECGRTRNTPVAVIKNGTRMDQTTVTGTLKNIADRVKKLGMGPPAVIVVGDVVKFRENLRWFDNRPLSGKRILVTRARRQASELSRLLMEQGAEPVELPAIDIQRLSETTKMDNAVANLNSYDWIIFTSVNGVESFFERLNAKKLDARTLSGIKVGVIGPATAKALQNQGITPDYTPAVFTSQGLIDGLKDLKVTGQAFLLPRADIADKELTRGLHKLKAKVHEVPAYKTVPAVKEIQQARNMLAAGKIDVITFTSSSTVTNLLAAFGSEAINLNGARVACIGPKTKETALKSGLTVDIVAREQTITGLVDSIKKFFQKGNNE